MLISLYCLLLYFATVLPSICHASQENQNSVSPKAVLNGLKSFYQKTARPDGSFTPGIDPQYRGMSDCAYSDLAAVTYAVTVHKTFGWKLPHEKKTIEFLLSRQKESGEFFNVAGTVDPESAAGKTYNTTQALVALHALGVKPRYNPLPVFDEILKTQDLHSLPPYMSSFFPLAYLCYGRQIPKKLDLAIRATMIQDEDGYLNNHIAATFHASHYYQLVGEPTPKTYEMLARILRDQKTNGSWLLHMPSRDRHATFDAVFTLLHEGAGRADCKAAIQRAAKWVLTCRNDDGGFGHFPGSTSDADAIYFHVGTLVMAGFLQPAQPLPKDPHLLSWGHLMPVAKLPAGNEKLTFHANKWISSVAFSPDGKRLICGSADGNAYVLDLKSGDVVVRLPGHSDGVSAVQFGPAGRFIVTCGYDNRAMVWTVHTALRRPLAGHKGVVMSAAFSPDGKRLATASVDGTIKLWAVAPGKLLKTLRGHKSWVNSVAFSPDGKSLISGSSDGTVRVWSFPAGKLLRTVQASDAEVRSVAISPDGKSVAAGIRYGKIIVWDTSNWKERLSFQGHRGDVWSIAFSPDGKWFVSGNGDWNQPGLVKIWDAGSGKMIGQLLHTGEVLSVAVSPDGNLIAAGAADNMVRVWDVSNMLK